MCTINKKQRRERWKKRIQRIKYIFNTMALNLTNLLK